MEENKIENKKQAEKVEKTEIAKHPVKEEEKAEKQEKVKDEKKKQDKKQEKKGPKKTEAIVQGKDLGISTKHAMAICKFIRGKTIEKSIFMLSEVVQIKRAIPMKGELPHRKGMERGRFPQKAAKEFIKLLRQLAANAAVNEMEIEKGRIQCKANRASRPYRRFGSQRFKRTHVELKLTYKKDRKDKKHKKKGEKK